MSGLKYFCQVVVKLLKRRDSLLRVLSVLLTKLTDCLSSLTDLALAVTLLTKDLGHTDTALFRTQIRRYTEDTLEHDIKISLRQQRHLETRVGRGQTEAGLR